MGGRRKGKGGRRGRKECLQSVSHSRPLQENRVYLLLSPAEMRSEVTAAVVCYLCATKGCEAEARHKFRRVFIQHHTDVRH